ncbi:type I phosphomannose isomerase catalytic subunit [Candidatus Methylacidithermus pantelleriae]|uniref:type I phosphomannose isomerase catalytic subunit n=1 Tax=Candidatus Methylacidithermus pantelleriae TaxID=2744239 RepID=UPI00157CDA99|nr:type I phosphomannose isomerase catalytic subunit [Candidatus Methylacidithermus pantelleriae]
MELADSWGYPFGYLPMAYWELAPIYQARVWGGRTLETSYGRVLPPGQFIGESWELCDRPEAQSYTLEGQIPLGELWRRDRKRIFGEFSPDSSRLPLLVKLLDCREPTSVQVHPNRSALQAMGHEPKAEAWYFLRTEPGAGFHAGFRRHTDPEEIRRTLRSALLLEFLHWIPSQAGQFFYNPAGRIHALGAGNLVFEVQENSDTTYRLYDWGRKREKERELEAWETVHACIQWDDWEPEPHFSPGSWSVELPFCSFWRTVLTRAEPSFWHPAGKSFLYHFCAEGSIRFFDREFGPGRGWLVSADHPSYTLEALSESAILLTVGFPGLASESLGGKAPVVGGKSKARS